MNGKRKVKSKNLEHGRTKLVFKNKMVKGTAMCRQEGRKGEQSEKIVHQ